MTELDRGRQNEHHYSTGASKTLRPPHQVVLIKKFLIKMGLLYG